MKMAATSLDHDHRDDHGACSELASDFNRRVVRAVTIEVQCIGEALLNNQLTAPMFTSVATPATTPASTALLLFELNVGTIASREDGDTMNIEP